MLARAQAFQGRNLLYANVELTGDDTTVYAAGFNGARAWITPAWELHSNNPNRFNTSKWDSCGPDDEEGIARLVANMFTMITREVPDSVHETIFARVVELAGAEYYHREGNSVIFMYKDNDAIYVRIRDGYDTDGSYYSTSDYDSLADKIARMHALHTRSQAQRMAAGDITRAIEILQERYSRDEHGDPMDPPPVEVFTMDVILQIYGETINVRSVLNGNTFMPGRDGTFDERIRRKQRAATAKKNRA